MPNRSSYFLILCCLLSLTTLPLVVPRSLSSHQGLDGLDFNSGVHGSNPGHGGGSLGPGGPGERLPLTSVTKTICQKMAANCTLQASRSYRAGGADGEYVDCSKKSNTNGTHP